MKRHTIAEIYIASIAIAIALLGLFALSGCIGDGGPNIGDVPPWALKLAADAQQIRIDLISLHLDKIPGDIEQLRIDFDATADEPELAAARLAYEKLLADYRMHADRGVLALDAFALSIEINDVIRPYFAK